MGSDVHDYKKLVKATQFVERSFNHRNYYVVLETEGGQKIRMELLASGKVAWDAEPADLEDRNSLAKVMHSEDCRPGLLVGDMKAYQTSLAEDISEASPTVCKRHAESIFAKA